MKERGAYPCWKLSPTFRAGNLGRLCQIMHILLVSNSRLVRCSPCFWAAVLLCAYGLADCLPAPAQPDASIAELRRSFASPPDSSRIMMRWWWFGPAVAKPELTR